MNKHLLLLCFLIANIFLSFAYAQDVGLRKIEMISQETNERFPMTTLYPTSSKPKFVKFGPFTMKVAIGGKIADGQFPLVILSHGSGASNLSYKDIAVSLVKHGFIVGMPLHPHNNYKNNDLEGTLQNYIHRPKHIRSAIDSILSDEFFTEHIDAKKIAVIGHSVGGYTALASAGANANTQAMIEVCENSISLSDPYCGLVHQHEMPSQKIENPKDKRIKAVVLLAPLGILFRDKGSLDQVDIPILLLSAEKDKELTEPYNSDVISNHIKDKNMLTYITIPNAGHYSFLTSYPEYLKSELGPIAEDPDGFNRVEFQQDLGLMISNYLAEVL